MTLSTRFVRLALLALTGLAFSACPDVPPADQLEAPPRINSFSADQAEVAPGTSVKLSWDVENAATVKIDEVKLGLVSGVSGNSGSVDVAITEPALFVLTVRNRRGASETAIVSVRTTVAGSNELVFAALPTAVNAGEPASLAWSAPGASSATITASPGGPLDLRGQASAGSLVVTPTETTTYTLTAGARTATAIVTVQPTIVSFAASTAVADAGSTITLSWSTAGASRVQVRSVSKGVVLADSADGGALSGTVDDTLPTMVDADQLFPYELTVTGGTTTLTESVVVAISGHPVVQTFTAPKYVSNVSDAGVTLAWTTVEANEVSIAAGSVEIFRAPAGAVSTGSVVVPVPTVDTTYTLTARHPRGNVATATASIEIVGPPTATLTATPNPARVGEPVTLSWSGTDIRNLRISNSRDGEMLRAANTMDTGTVPGTSTFANEVVFFMEFDNGAGQHGSTKLTLPVSDALQFTTGPGSVAAGVPFTLSWTPAVEITGLPHADVVTRTGSTGFDDIATTGTAVSVTADGTNSFQPQNFIAPFFGALVGKEVWVSSDGFMSFSPAGASNWSAVAVPSAKLEALSIAPCWSDITTSNLRWQVKDLTDGRVLIVQWDQRFQVKVFTTGQVDVEYRTLGSLTCSNRGVRGRFGDSGFAFATAPADNLGLTLFGPKTGSATLTLRHDVPISGSYVTGTTRVPFSTSLAPIVQARDLYVSEAMVQPAAAVGQNGQWFELFNATANPIDLTGWQLGVSDGGVPGLLSGTIAPRSVLVVGSSTDPSLNDDAGVQLALTGFDPGQASGSVSLRQDGGINSFSWSSSTPGTAFVADMGPFKYNTDSSGTAARAQTCTATTTFGSQTPAQFGTPGTVSHCGFPYTLDEIAVGFFDISGFGEKATFSSLDTANVTVPLTASPFPYFGTPRTAMRVSTNGFVAFDTSTSSSITTNDYPSTSDPNAALAILAGDLVGHSAANSGVYTARVGANVDPYAPAPHWIIQWKRWAMYSSTPTDDLNFEIKLFDDGAIEYHYEKMVHTSSTRGAAGTSVNTWIENPTGTQALVINTRAFAPGISPFTAFRFTPR